jgi:23S rRNA pseudouridine1911/1915/1917 synthase
MKLKFYSPLILKYIELSYLYKMKYTTKQTKSLLETVMDIYKGISKQKAKQIISHSEFTISGNRIEKHLDTVIPEGIILELVSKGKELRSKDTKSKLKPKTVLFEDKYLLAALKPAGILSCASRNDKVDYSFHKELEYFISERDRKKTRLFVIHRIDREVEGILMFAKTEEMQIEMKHIWPDVTKKYMALTEKKPSKTSGVIENWLKDTESQKVKEYNYEISGSKFAKTEYRFIKGEKKYSLIEVTLHTGRKNQIRVHLSGIGCPIVGDRKYGAEPLPVRQIRLAAWSMEFVHPKTGNTMEIKYQPGNQFFNPSQKEDEKYK